MFKSTHKKRLDTMESAFLKAITDIALEHAIETVSLEQKIKELEEQLAKKKPGRPKKKAVTKQVKRTTKPYTLNPNV